MLTITKHKEHITIEINIQRKLLNSLFEKIKNDCACEQFKTNTKGSCKIDQSCEVVFSQTNEKNNCISDNMESFCETGLRKKNQHMGLFYIPFWYNIKTRDTALMESGFDFFFNKPNF